MILDPTDLTTIARPLQIRSGSVASSRHEPQDYAAFQGTPESGMLILLDGVTGSGLTCDHGVAWFVKKFSHYCLAADDDSPLSLVVEGALAWLRLEHPQCTKDPGGLNDPQTTCMLVRWSLESVEFLALGDSILAFYDSSGALLSLVRDTMETRLSADSRAGLVRAIATHGINSLAVDDWSLSARNAEGGFFLAGSDPSVSQRALTGSFTRSSVSMIVAASDGIYDLPFVDALSDDIVAFSDPHMWDPVIRGLSLDSSSLPTDHDDVTVMVVTM